MTDGKRIQILVSDEIRKALTDWVAEHGGNVAELMRTAALEKIGRKDLIQTMRPVGRPWPKSTISDEHTS